MVSTLRKPTRSALPTGPREVRILGVDYLHKRTAEGGDLYLTDYGRQVGDHLDPENWHELKWFAQKRQRLFGTSMIYRLVTRPVHNRIIELVVRYNRMAQDLPMDNAILSRFPDAEFHTPFEEFSMVLDLRSSKFGPSGLRIRTKRPLAIYSPPGEIELWQSGRAEGALTHKLAMYPELPLDIRRRYLVVYGWIDGCDAGQAAELLGMQGQEKEEYLKDVVSFVSNQLRTKGFCVVDMKPNHVIVRFDRSGKLLHDRNGNLVYALIDYELLIRTPEYESSLHKQQVREESARGRRQAAPSPV